MLAQEQKTLETSQTKVLPFVQENAGNSGNFQELEKCPVRKLAFDIGNRRTKIAYGGNANIQATGFPSVVAKTENGHSNRSFLDGSGQDWIYGTGAERAQNPRRMLSDLGSLTKARKLAEFDLFFRAPIVRVTNLKELEKVQCFELVISTSVSQEDYQYLKETAESLTEMYIGGKLYRYEIEVSAIVPEGWGIIREGRCESREGVLFDFGHGTNIITFFKANPFEVDRQPLPLGCAGVYTAWSKKAAKSCGGVLVDPQILASALDREQIVVTPNGRGRKARQDRYLYQFVTDSDLNEAYNAALTEAVAEHWEKISEVSLFTNAIENAKLSGHTLKACGGGAILFANQLETLGVEIVDDPVTANVRGLQGWLNVQGGRKHG